MSRLRRSCPGLHLRLWAGRLQIATPGLAFCFMGGGVRLHKFVSVDLLLPAGVPYHRFGQKRVAHVSFMPYYSTGICPATRRKKSSCCACTYNLDTAVQDWRPIPKRATLANTGCNPPPSVLGLTAPHLPRLADLCSANLQGMKALNFREPQKPCHS